MILPIGDTPNPQNFTPWVNWALIALNVAVYLFISLPLSSTAPDLTDPDYLKSVLDSVRDEASSLASPPPTPIPTPSTTTYGLTPSTSARPTDSSAPSTFRKLEDGSRRSTGRSS